MMKANFLRALLLGAFVGFGSLGLAACDDAADDAGDAAEEAGDAVERAGDAVD